MDHPSDLSCRGEQLCLQQGKYLHLRQYDALVLSRPDLVSDIVCSEDLQVEFIAAPSRFLYSLMPLSEKDAVDDRA